PLPRHGRGRGRHPQRHAHRGGTPVPRSGGAPACLRGADAARERSKRDAVDHIFRRPRKPKAVLLGASILLFLMAIGSAVLAIRGEPLTLGEEVVAVGLEATSYRIGGALLSARRSPRAGGGRRSPAPTWARIPRPRDAASARFPPRPR